MSPENEMLARNIINQIGDIYSERIPSDQWVPVRQETNDLLDEFVAGLLASRDEEIRFKVLLHLAGGLNLMKAGYKGNAVWRWVSDVVERDLAPMKEIHDCEVASKALREAAADIRARGDVGVADGGRITIERYLLSRANNIEDAK